MLVVSGRRHVSPGPAGVPVVVVGGAHRGGQGGVGAELGVAAVGQRLRITDRLNSEDIR